MQFAKTLGISHSEIDKKVCKTKGGYSNGTQSFGVYALTTATDKDASSGLAAGNTSLCGDVGGSQASKGDTSPQVLKDFVKKTLTDGSKNWPTSTGGKTTPKTNDNANAVAKDLVALNRDEKTIVAGLLAKTIEGGEVVEIRAVSSTYSMANFGHRYRGFIVIESITMQSSEVTLEYSAKYKYAYYI
ncbi:hypothetical protein ANAPC1_01288 [Anaplasma phagocytophilum]|uniref:Uncharacterized protein n=1 Tax=Anaplasma phagocytophilum TaxID=948 RepID=A0AA45UUC3_ANAPH|nr:hypothetical protein ANAPC1_01288 [Anaplasma phagocytophilum]SBO33458.1 hypothetical protein ANAPC2_01365 [Anaplasma phagocytophilum]SBO33862.1 hypothetical protein ANAPC4_01326 [Anaplasma phagocytophilum]